MKDNLTTFEEVFKKQMKNKDFDSYKKDYPTLLNVINESMVKAQIGAVKEVLKECEDDHVFMVLRKLGNQLK
jgi:hypothetical protein